MKSQSKIAGQDDPSKIILENHKRFLAFIRSRVGSQEAAEELLQEAYVKALKQADKIKDKEKIVAWFYRLLRNSLVDFYRRQSAEVKVLERFVKDAPSHMEDKELEKAVCKCVGRVIETLKPEYSSVLKKFELEDESLKTIAQESGVTPGNAAVRLHRARESLKKSLLQTCGDCASHGCMDCNCRHP